MATLKETTLKLAKQLFTALKGVTEADAGTLFRFVEDAVRQSADARSDVQKLRDFFDGDQISGTGLNSGTYYIPTWPDESDEDKEARAERMKLLAWNRVRDGILTHADALYAWGRGRAVSRQLEWKKGFEPNQGVQDWLDLYFSERVWPMNHFGQFMWDVWRTVGAERQAVVMLMWMDASGRRLKRFTSRDRRVHKENGVMWLEILDNLNVIALPHPEQSRTLGAVIRWYLRDDLTDNPLMASGVATPGQANTVTELITDKHWFRWVGTTLEPTPWGIENRYGDVRDVFVWARNPADISDAEDALSAQTLLLEDLYNGAAIKRNHAFPETLYVAFEPPYREEGGRKILDKGPSTAYVAPDPNADIKKVGPPARLSEVGLAEDRIHQMLDEAMGLTSLGRGESSGLGQMRSAPALGRVMGNSERRRRRKILAALRFEQELFEALVSATAFHCFSEQERERFRFVRQIVSFPEDAFTLDPYSEAQKDAIEAGAGIETRDALLRKRHPDATDEQIEEMLEGIKEDMGAAGDPGQSADPTPMARSQAQEA